MIRFPLDSSVFINPRYVPTSAWVGHIPFASWLINRQRPEIVVELGTHHGASFLAFCQAISEGSISAKCFAVDTWEGDHQAGLYSNEVYTTLLDYQQRHYAGISQMLRMTFDDALAHFVDGTVDLLHIDGLHTYEAVKHDFDTWLCKMSDRGVVIFHDTCVRKDDFGVWKFWEEVRERFPHFEFTHTHGLGVLLVGKQQPAELTELAACSSGTEHAIINSLFDGLGRNLKNVSEIERVNSALVACHAEIARLAAALDESEQMRRSVAEREVAQVNAFVELQAVRDEVAAHARRFDRIDDLQTQVLERETTSSERQATMLKELSEALEALRCDVNRSWFRKPHGWVK